MPRHVKLRTGLLAALAVSIAASGGLVAVGIGAPGGDQLPNLEPYLPTSDGTPHSRFMDTVQQPGHTLLRFDTVLKNVATNTDARLDLFRTGAGQPTQQKVWQTGDALDDPTAGGTPPAGNTSVITGHDFFYFDAAGHEHFHFPHAAQYQLVSSSGAVIADSPKNTVGFCLFDSYGAGAFAQDPCHRNDPSWTGVIRMGISPGVGDLYGAGLTDQWVDVTTVMPGEYQIKAIANPDGVIKESTTSDNVKLFPITVAGAAPAVATGTTTAGTTVDVPLSATVYGADIDNRIVPPGTNCGGSDADLYTAASQCFADNPNGNLATFTVTGATGGTASIVNQSGRTATLRFVPKTGFSGTATVTYTATDARGLTSPPVAATITVTPASGLSSTPPGGATGTPHKAKVTLAPRLSVVHRKGRYYVRVTGHVTKSLVKRKVVVQRRVGTKRIVTMARIRVGKAGGYAALVRMPSRTVTVRTFVGSTNTTKAAVSRFRTLSR
jgi:hypothetical protein